MSLWTFLPLPARIGIDLLGLAAIAYSGYTLVYKPIEQHGEAIGFDRGVQEQKKETDKESKRANDAEKALKDAQDANQKQLDELARVAREQLASLEAQKDQALKRAAVASSNYKIAREQALQELLKRQGRLNLPDPDKPYFAPDDIAGLSKAGVDRINYLVEK
jgi:hypothetical protein